MTLLNKVYQAVFRRTSTFALAIVVGAFFFERAFDQGGQTLFEQMNRGKLYKDVKHRFQGAGEEEEE
ncbi:hypothetical protein BaRGS_00002684 [Batillaria attramentaria]|uniref:Complex III subunit 9 n=1 Tax=Batillaria attramentaria TaxID=370345 RepID=A0ABD0M415_9CAEN